MPERSREWVANTLVPALQLSRTISDACLELGVSKDAVRWCMNKHGFGDPSRYVAWSGPLDPARELDTKVKLAPSCAAGSATDMPTGRKRQVCGEGVDPLDAHVARTEARTAATERKELLDRLRVAEERADFAAEVRAAPPPRIAATEHTSGLREATAVVLASDWHVEELVHPATVAGRNEYTPEIAARRAGRFFDGAAWLVANSRHGFVVRNLILGVLGDLISGYIHEELEEDNPLSPVQATVLAKGLLSAGLRRLLKDGKLERIVVPCVIGNHGRTSDRRKIKTAWRNSYEWLAYTMVAEEFKDEKRVQFVVPESSHAYVEAYGFALHFAHGDDLRYAGGVGGLAIPLGKRVPMWDRVRRADLHHIGHFHQFRDFGHTVVNGSLIGYTDFAMSIGAEYEEPRQAFYLLDSKRGKSITAPVWVSEIDERRAA